MVVAAPPLDASHGTRRRCNRRRRGCARAVRGLHQRAAEPGGVPELRAGGEHGGEAGRLVLLGAQGSGEDGGGLPLPGLPGQPELRRHPQHDQGPAAALRLQGQDTPLQQVPPFYPGCDRWGSSSCPILRGSVFRRVAAVDDTFGITGRNRKQLRHSSSIPVAFRCSHLPGVNTRLLGHCNRCRDAARVPCLVSWAHRLTHPSHSIMPA